MWTSRRLGNLASPAALPRCTLNEVVYLPQLRLLEERARRRRRARREKRQDAYAVGDDKPAALNTEYWNQYHDEASDDQTFADF